MGRSPGTHPAKDHSEMSWTELVGIFAVLSLLVFAYYAFNAQSDLPHTSLRTSGETGSLTEGRKQALPTVFDSRANWPKCSFPVWNAGEDCPGGTWAIAAADVLSHQLCVQTGLATILSPQAILNCVKPPNADGCSAGSPADAWDYTTIYGLPNATCLPYTGRIAGCSSACPTASPGVSALSATYKAISGTTAIQSVIQRKGAVQATFEEFTDFVTYSGGIYEHKSGLSQGTVSVKLVGWGAQAGVKYWVGVAAKGGKWGMSGCFYIKMGQLGVENNVVG